MYLRQRLSFGGLLLLLLFNPSTLISGSLHLLLCDTGSLGLLCLLLGCIRLLHGSWLQLQLQLTLSNLRHRRGLRLDEYGGHVAE